MEFHIGKKKTLQKKNGHQVPSTFVLPALFCQGPRCAVLVGSERKWFPCLEPPKKMDVQFTPAHSTVWVGIVAVRSVRFSWWAAAIHLDDGTQLRLKRRGLQHDATNNNLPSGWWNRKARRTHWFSKWYWWGPDYWWYLLMMQAPFKIKSC